MVEGKYYSILIIAQSTFDFKGLLNFQRSHMVRVCYCFFPASVAKSCDEIYFKIIHHKLRLTADYHDFNTQLCVKINIHIGKII